ncbi:MAG: hypothetical protein WA139_03095 [Candidatus Aenigmatarchaeota archaeon]
MIDENEIREFSEAIIETYKNLSILKEISQIIEYSDGIKCDFIQIGERVLLPKEFFKKGNNIDNRFLGGDFARSVIWGEENFIINQLTELAEKGKILSVQIKDFSYPTIVQYILRVDNPTDIFIPIDLEPYYMKVHDWIKEGNAGYEGSQLYIFAGEKKIRVHWSTKYTPFDSIIVLDRDGVKIVQKRFEDIKIPKEFITPIYSYKKSEPFRIDFAESDKPDHFDCYIRSVFAIYEIEKESIYVIKLPKDEKSKK